MQVLELVSAAVIYVWTLLNWIYITIERGDQNEQLEADREYCRSIGRRHSTTCRTAKATSVTTGTSTSKASAVTKSASTKSMKFDCNMEELLVEKQKTPLTRRSSASNNPYRLSGWFRQNAEERLSLGDFDLEKFENAPQVMGCSSFSDLNELHSKPVMFSPPPLVWSSSSNSSNVNDCKYDRQQILSWIYIFGFKDPVARKLRSYERDLDGDALEYVYTAFKVQEYERANMFIELKLPTAKSVPLMELLVFKCQLLLSAGNVENARLFSKMLIGEAEAWMGNYLTRATGEAFIVAGTLIGYKCDVLSNSPVDYVFFAKEYSRNEDVLFFIAHYHLTRSEIYLGEVYFKKLKKMCPNHPNVPFFKEMVKIGLDGKMPTLETFDSITNLIRSVHNGLNDYAIYQMYVFLMIFRDKLKADGLEEYLTVETEADNLLSMLRKLEEIDIADPKKYVHTFYAISLEIMSTSLINVKL